MGSDFVELPTYMVGPRRYRASMIWAIAPYSMRPGGEKNWTTAYLVGIAEPVTLTEDVDAIQARIDRAEGVR
jgi:hypothetical protein